eukprot:285637-Amphidinium_carterae.1
MQLRVLGSLWHQYMFHIGSRSWTNIRPRRRTCCERQVTSVKNTASSLQVSNRLLQVTVCAALRQQSCEYDLGTKRAHCHSRLSAATAKPRTSSRLATRGLQAEGSEGLQP